MASNYQLNQLDIAIPALQAQVFRLQLVLVLGRNEIYREKTEEEKEIVSETIEKIQEVAAVCRSLATPFDGAVELSKIRHSSCTNPWIL